MLTCAADMGSRNSLGPEGSNESCGSIVVVVTIKMAGLTCKKPSSWTFGQAGHAMEYDVSLPLSGAKLNQVYSVTLKIEEHIYDEIC